jgi:hypothetical protein
LGPTHPDHLVKGISFRPSNRQLYAFSAVGNQYQLYTVDQETAQLTAVGGLRTGAHAFAGSYSMDFDPTTDTLRLVSHQGANLTLNPNSGELIAVHSPLRYAPGDPAFGTSTRTVGIAHAREAGVPEASTAYVMEALGKRLTRLGAIGGAANSANSGELSSDRPLTGLFNEDYAVAIAITPDRRIFLSAFGPASPAAPVLYALDLDSGDYLSGAQMPGITPPTHIALLPLQDVADLQLSMTASPAQAREGQTVAIVATAQNAGPGYARNTQVVLVLDSGLSVQSIDSGSGGECETAVTSGTISCVWAGYTRPGLARSVTIAAAGLGQGRVTTTATAGSSTPDPIVADNTASVAVFLLAAPSVIPVLDRPMLLALTLALLLGGLASRRRPLRRQ